MNYEQGNQEAGPQPTLDVYALAATLYYAVTGQKPQASMNRKMFGDKLEPTKQLCSEIPNWLDRAIWQGMALEADDRPASMQAWAGLLTPPQPKPLPQPVYSSPQPRPQPAPQPSTVSSTPNGSTLSRQEFLRGVAWGGFAGLGLLTAFGISQFFKKETPDPILSSDNAPSSATSTETGSPQSFQADYDQLEELLQAGQWQEADQATLDLMLKIANREEDGWLDIDNIENFPCDALGKIDQLWVEASNGQSSEEDLYETHRTSKIMYWRVGGCRH